MLAYCSIIDPLVKILHKAPRHKSAYTIPSGEAILELHDRFFETLAEDDPLAVFRAISLIFGERCARRLAPDHGFAVPV